MAALCVPEKGSQLRKWFTDLAKELNIDEDWLEPKIHEFWNQFGEQKTVDGRNVDNIPTATELKEFLIGTNEVTSQEQIDIWEREYKEPIKVASYSEASAISEEASKMFPKESVIVIKTQDNSYLVAVAKPTLVSSPTMEDTTSPSVSIHEGFWKRDEVAADTERVYLFGDNTDDRVNTHHVPMSTQAVIRELPNAIGIDTKKNRGTKENSYFTDEDFESFKNGVDTALQLALATGKQIVLPADGIGTGRAMLEQKAPKCFEYLQQQLNLLKEGKLKKVTETTENKNTVDTKFEQHSKSINQQVDSLNSNDVGLSQSEIREIADQCVYWISDMITNYLQNPEELFSTYKFEKLRTLDKEGNWTEANKKKDISKVQSMSRADLIRFLGIQNVMDLCKEVLFENNPILSDDNTEQSLIEQADVLSDNFDGLMNIASSTWASVEKFSIEYNPEVNDLKVNEELNRDEDNFNESNDLDEVRETQGDSRESWQMDRRTEEVLSSMSQIVRNELTQCYEIERFDEAGNPVYRKSKFGVRLRVDAKDATSRLLRWTQGSISYEDMIEKIKGKLKYDNNGTPTENLWLTQLISKLSIVPEQENSFTDFQSQFFGVFDKHFQPYSIIVKDEDGYKNVPINERPALKDATNMVSTQYKIGDHPIFNQGQAINEENLNKFNEVITQLQSLTLNNNKVRSLQELSEQRESLVNLLTGASNYLGYYVTPDIVEGALVNDKALSEMVIALGYISKALSNEKNNANYDPFKASKDNPNGIYGNLKKFLTPLTEVLEDTAISSFYDSGKMYQSYVTPSYMTKLMNKFHLEGAEFDKFIMEEYGKTEWFHRGTNIESGWNNEWLKRLATMPSKTYTDERGVKHIGRDEVFRHKVQLSFNKHNYMRNMSDTEYALSVILEYFTGKDNIAYFRLPMLSNKPSSEFISFYKYSGDFTEGTISPAKQSLIDGFYKIFLQELSRIQTCREREKAGITGKDPIVIKNFDTNGKKFMFLDFLNTFIGEGESVNTELGKLIEQKLSNDKTIDENKLNELVKNEILVTIDAKATKIVEGWKSQGVFEAVKQADLAGKEDAEVENSLREFVWNDAFASMNIIQLTVTDIAYYKDAEDLQKRLAQIHAPGIRANVSATDYTGRKVSDGFSRTLYLTDFEGIKSNIIANVSTVFDKKIEAAPEEHKAQYRALKESIIKSFNEDINLADAQAFCSPTALRKKMFLFGKWSKQKEDMYQRLRKGEYKFDELKEVFSQPTKPFVYSQVNRSSYVKGAPIKTLKVGIQNKNSEYLLLMADAILQGEKTGRPNLLRAIFKVMEESHYDKDGNYLDNGIDTVQFESAVKAGLCGKLDLRPFSNMYSEYTKYDNPADGENAAVDYMRNCIYTNTEKDIEYNSVFVQTFPYEDYCIQQEVPEHFRNHEQAHGSQTRYIIPSDLEEVNSDSKPVTYDFFDPNSTNPDKIERLSAKKFKEVYENTIAENIQESLSSLREELFMDDAHIGDIKAQNIALSRLLQKEILSSPRYGIDLLQACSVDENGNFRIPLGDPIQSKRVEQLINSIIKNRVNKQKIAGGPVVQVTNFGTSRELNVRFKDKNGGVLQTREEYRGTKKYEDYVKENQGGVAYWEVFAPIPSEDFYNRFADENGNIDIKAVEAADPDLLKMIGYRIPTEDKYSIMPMKIVGFLPREAGDGIMMPADVVLTTGSDFDVDKMYLMIKSLTIKAKESELAQQELFDRAVDAKVFEGRSDVYILSRIKKFLENPQKMKDVNEETRFLNKVYKQVGTTVVHPTEGREYRNNKILDMSYAVLTSETTADKALNPGGFEPQKRMGYMVEAKRLNPEKSWEELQGLKISDLKKLCYTTKNLCFIDTHTQFYKQNSAAGQILGMFAVQKVAHAALESDGFSLDVASVCKLPIVPVKNPDGTLIYDRNGEVVQEQQTFNIAGMEFGGDMELDKKYDNTKVTLIGKVLGSLVASAADAVKDPVLNLMNINSQTAGVLTSLVRLGMPFEDAALFLSQKIITDVLNDYNSRNITSFTKLADVIDEYINEIQKTNGWEDSVINEEALSKDELIMGLINDDPRLQYKTLIAFKRVQEIAKAIKGLTTATRFNSISNAVGPLVIDNLIMEHKMDNFSQYLLDNNGNPLVKLKGKNGIGGINIIFEKHPILGYFAEAVEEAKKLFRDMPANSIGFRGIMMNLENFGGLQEIVYNDRKLMSQLSDFYQAYILSVKDNRGKDTIDRIADNANLSESQRGLEYFIDKFPGDFFRGKAKERYPDNLLIQSIKMDVNKGSKRPVLKIDITGLDPKQKEKLSAAWADLHKDNPKLSTMLFLYNYYRTGVGFSPKTFMSLVPTSVKASPELKPYVDAYRRLPTVVPPTVIDQFIRNNWGNSKLVPSGSRLHATFKGDQIVITREDEQAQVKDKPYIKMKLKGIDTLLKQASIDKATGNIYYERIDALGNNGEYLEISESNIVKSKESTTVSLEETPINNPSELGETSNQQIDGEETSPTSMSDKQLTETLINIYQTSKNNTREKAVSYIESFKTKSAKEKMSFKKAITSFMEKRLNELGIKFDSNLVEELFIKMC